VSDNRSTSQSAAVNHDIDGFIDDGIRYGIELDTLLQLAESVERGVALLDRKLPGWASSSHVPAIDAEHLLMVSGRACILGQLYGDYFNGTEALGLGARGDYHNPLAIENGFTLDLRLFVSQWLRGSLWRALGDAWIAEINRRREESSIDDDANR